jgi:hypothetical protein
MPPKIEPTRFSFTWLHHKDAGAWLVAVLIVTATVCELRRQGRLWWCECGGLNPWAGNIWSPHNSQHLFDPYSFTHILHGVLLCGFIAWACPRLSLSWQLCLVIAAESFWEVVENTNFIIDRYRLTTLAVGYQGDTIANSLSDIFSAVVGFLLARRLGIRGSVVLFIATEAVLIFWIRDSLLLNVVMLLCPSDTIRAWQMGL